MLSDSRQLVAGRDVQIGFEQNDADQRHNLPGLSGLYAD